MVAVSSALEVDQVVAGNEAVVSDGSVFVELPHFDHAACPTVPRADGIFFLDDRGDARITATHVQGFLLGGRGRQARERLGELRGDAAGLGTVSTRWTSVGRAR
jgi:hypothetical protein